MPKKQKDGKIGQSPYFRRFGSNPDLSKFRVFGSPVGKFIDASNRSKLESTAVYGVYFGNSAPMGSQRNFSKFVVFIPETQTIQKIGQVKIIENIDTLGFVAAHPLTLDWDSVSLHGSDTTSEPTTATCSGGSFVLQQNNLPADLTIGKQKIFSKVSAIVRHYAWFDDADFKESYAVIEVSSFNRKNSSLVTVRDFINSATDKEANFNLLKDYLKLSYTKFPSIFPLLAITSCEYEQKKWENSIIISSDPNDSLVFGVAIPDFSLASPVVDIRDVPRDAVSIEENFIFAASDKTISAAHSVPRSLAGIDRLPDAAEWWTAYYIERDQMFHQYKAIEPLKSLPSNVDHCLRLMVVFNVKRDFLGFLDKYKCRIVVMGNEEVASLDYDKYFRRRLKLKLFIF